MNKWTLIEKKIEDNRAEEIRALQEFIQIPSVVTEPEGDFPFGSKVQDAFMFMLEAAQRDGFETLNVDNYGGHIDFRGNGKSSETMGIVGHVDVVPVGNGWDVDPFGGLIRDGRIYGRGALDDKGPTIAAYYAMKALKEVGIVPEKTIRLILGNDEETNWSGMKYYLDRVEAPDFGITPDSEFPVINGEKGLLKVYINKKINPENHPGLKLVTMSGGSALNMVADSAMIVLNDSSDESYERLDEIIAGFVSEKGADISRDITPRGYIITVAGKAAHGARPERGVNAIPIAMDLLERIDLKNTGVSDVVKMFNTFIGYNYYGENIGIGFSDEQSGKLIFNVGTLEMDAGIITLGINIRYPVTVTLDQIREQVRPVLDRYDCTTEIIKHTRPIYIPEDDPMIKTLVDAYRERTGDYDTPPKVIPGQTYSKLFKKFAAYGMRFSKADDVAHQKNESVDIEKLILTTKIYADAIYRLTAGKENE